MNSHAQYVWTDETAFALARRAWEPPLPTLVRATASLQQAALTVDLYFASPPADDVESQEAISDIETEVIADIPPDVPITETRTIVHVVDAQDGAPEIWKVALQGIAPLADLVGHKLVDVQYASTAVPMGEAAPFGFDMAEMVLLDCGNLKRTIWVSEGSADTLAVGGDIGSFARNHATSSAIDRGLWKKLIGAEVIVVSASSVRADAMLPRPTPSPLMVQALHINFENGCGITVAGCRPPDEGPEAPVSRWLDSTWFDDLAVLPSYWPLGDMSKRVTLPLKKSA